MSVTISDNQARVYEFARANAGRWLTVQEIAVSTNVTENTVKAHAARFEEVGIFERIRISPSHAFRLDANADKHAHKLVLRLTEAVQIFSERRSEWLKREQTILRKLDAGVPEQNSRPVIEDTASALRMVAAGLIRESDASEHLAVEDSQLMAPTNVDLLSQGGNLSLVSSTDALEPLSVASTNDKEGSIRPRGSKFDVLLSMVSRPDGASIDELVAALGNLAHSIRATISVESRKRGLKIECQDSRYYLKEPVLHSTEETLDSLSI